MARKRKQAQQVTPTGVVADTVAVDDRPNAGDNLPEQTTPADVAFRDATFSVTTRDALAAGLGLVRRHAIDHDFAAAVEDVVARWDANEATEIVLPDEPFEIEDAEAA